MPLNTRMSEQQLCRCPSVDTSTYADVPISVRSVGIHMLLYLGENIPSKHIHWYPWAVCSSSSWININTDNSTRAVDSEQCQNYRKIMRKCMQAPWQHADADIWVEIEKHTTKHPVGTDFVTGGGAAVWKSRNMRIKRKRERMSEKQWYVPLSKVPGPISPLKRYTWNTKTHACKQRWLQNWNTTWLLLILTVPTGKEKTKTNSWDENCV